jgi:hypothetical protein
MMLLGERDIVMRPLMVRKLSAIRRWWPAGSCATTRAGMTTSRSSS